MSSSSDIPRVRDLRARARALWQSPLGPVEILASPRGLRLVEFLGSDRTPLSEDEAREALPATTGAASASGQSSRLESDEGGLRRGGFEVHSEPAEPTRPRPPEEDAIAHAIVAQAVRELEGYFAGDRTSFAVPLDLAGTAFQRSVWDALLRVPYGTTVTYRQLAAAVGRPAAVRAVGAANGGNPVAVIVPCHRVVGSDGSLTGYAGGLQRKRALLELEQAALRNEVGATVLFPRLPE